MHKFLQKAAMLVRKHDYGDWQEFHLCALIVQGGNILSIGYNKSRHHAYINTISQNDWTNMHAEVDAILKSRKKIDLSGSKMFVVRMIGKGNTNFAIARPCESCQIALENYGIKKVYYSIDNNTYAVMRI